MENPRDTKQKQMKALVEKMKQEGKPIEGLPMSFAEPARPAASGRTVFLSCPHSMVLQKVYFIGGAMLH